MQLPVKPISVIISIVFTVFWGGLVAYSIPTLFDAMAHFEQSKLRVFIVTLVLVLSVYWTFIGIKWGFDDSVGEEEK